MTQGSEQGVVLADVGGRQGHRVAQADLGDLSEEGQGVPRDLTKAFNYHKLGAAQGWWRAELRLGLEYELAYGAPRNRATAILWLDRAPADGKDGLSQQLATKLQRSDTPARFKDMNDLSALHRPGRPSL